jgi:hypothetical protein
VVKAVSGPGVALIHESCRRCEMWGVLARVGLHSSRKDQSQYKPDENTTKAHEQSNRRVYTVSIPCTGCPGSSGGSYHKSRDESDVVVDLPRTVTTRSVSFRSYYVTRIITR